MTPLKVRKKIFPRYRRRRHYTFIEEEIPSCDLGLFFHGKFLVEWKHSSRLDLHHSPKSAIRSVIWTHAEALCRATSVARVQWLQDRINGELGTFWKIAGGQVLISWVETTLSVTDDALAEAQKRLLRKTKNESRKLAELEHLEYVDSFRSRVLSDPGMALTYWFIRRPEDSLNNGLAGVENLSRKIAMYDPERSWVQIGIILQDFVRGLSSEERKDSLDALRWWFRRYERADLVERLPRDTEEVQDNLEDEFEA